MSPTKPKERGVMLNIFLIYSVGKYRNQRGEMIESTRLLC